VPTEKPAKTTAAKTTAKKTTTAAEPPAETGPSSPQKVKGTIKFFDPATGRGAVHADHVPEDIVVDMAKTKILNKGYVRLDPGRPVTLSVEGDSATELLAE